MNIELRDRIERRPITALVPYARNSRTHSDEQVAQIAASMKEWGWTNPVLVDEEGGIIAGHGRVLAARRLGLAEVPVIVAAGWTEAQRRAYVIADNKLALNAGWDDEVLRIELADLQDLGFELDAVGFSDEELEGLLPAGADAVTEMPELASGDRQPFQQMTFTLHDEQAEQVRRALEAARELGPFVDALNENGNGNALARVCEIFLTQHGD